MNTMKTITLDELRRTPLTEEEKQIIHNATTKAKVGNTVDDPDCPRQTKEELAKFRPWYELHKDLYKSKKTDVHIRIDSDVLEWFKEQGKGYQTKINAVLRAYAFG